MMPLTALFLFNF